MQKKGDDMALSTRSTFMSALATGIAAAVLTLVVLAIFALPSSADDSSWIYDNCRYDPDSIAPIQWKFHAVESYNETAFRSGQTSWIYKVHFL